MGAGNPEQRVTWSKPRGHDGRSSLMASGLATVLLLSAGGAGAVTLDEVYGGMANGCTYDEQGNYRIATAYVDEGGAAPVLARPRGGRRLASFLGKASLDYHGEFYTLTIPVAGARLHGIPVSQLEIYRGTGADIAGVAITFPLPREEVKARLRRAGVKLVPHDHGWGDVMPQLEPARNGTRTELICDLSM